MEDARYYLSEYGNIWAVDFSRVECNNEFVTNDLECAAPCYCEVGGHLGIEEHDLGRKTISKNIVAISEKMSNEQLEKLIETLSQLKKLYGPISLKNEKDSIIISVFSGEGTIERIKEEDYEYDSYKLKYFDIGTVDFENATVSLKDDIAIEGIKLQAQENWRNIKDIIELFEGSIEFDYDRTLDADNIDLSDSRTLNAYKRVTQKKIEKGIDIIIKQKDEQEIDK